MFDKFTHVQYREGLGKHCPALTDMETGGIIINADLWPWLSNAEQREVISHEEGHWVNKTFDETAADEYSLLKQYREGHSVTQAISAMEKMLDRNNPEHIRRINDRKKLIQQITIHRHRHNNEPFMKTENNNGCSCSDCNHQNKQYAPYGILGICLSKKCKAAKAAKQATILELKVDRQEANNEAKVLLAQQGIKGGVGGLFSDLVQTVAPALTSIAGGGGILSALTGGVGTTATQPFANPTTATQQTLATTNTDYMYAVQEQEATDKKKKTTTWIIIGVSVVVVAVIIFFLVRKKAA